MASANQKQSPWDTANVFSKAFFCFVSPMMMKGFQKPLNQTDLDPLPHNETADVVIEQLRVNWENECNLCQTTDKRKPSMQNAIYNTFQRDILLSGWWAFLESATRISQPLLLGYLLQWLTTSAITTSAKNDTTSNHLQEGLLWSLALSTVGFIQIVVHHRLYYLTMFCGAKIRIACSGLVNRKLLNLHSSSLLNASSGKLINLISNDVMRFDFFLPRLHFGWTAPLEIPIIGFLLYIRVGLIATLSGVAFLFLTVPLQMYFSRRLGAVRKITAGWTDKRMKTTAEIFSGILSIKAFVWEKPFSKLVDSYRQKERASIFHAMTMKSLNTAISFFAPNVTILIIICTYYTLGNELTISLVFSTLALVHVLRTTIGKNLCMFLEQVGEAATSVKRIELFLLMDEYTGNNTNDSDSNNMKGTSNTLESKEDNADIDMASPLSFNNASFKWSKRDTKYALENLSLELCKNDLCVVDGETGSGKSAFLQAILGEMLINDDCAMKHVDSIAYASQKAWIKSGSIKLNIVWGADSSNNMEETVSDAYDNIWYQRVIRACCLEKDLEQLPDKDLTEIGERGVNLSGGQRARIGLARAVYAKKKLILLDDVLAACDTKVARHIFHNCVLELLKDRCVILVTHNTEYQQFATKHLTISNGKIIKYVKNEEMLKLKNNETKDYYNAKENIAEPKAVAVKTDGDLKEKKPTHILVTKEERVRGKIKNGTFYKYMHSAGDMLVFSVGFLLIAAQSVSFATEFTLKSWTESTGGNDNNSNYLSIFIILTAVVIVLSFVRVVLFFHAALQASTSIHNKAFTSVVMSPLTFFVQNPLGRILNKFSSDLGQADEALPTTLYRCLESLCLCFGSLIICCIAVPWILIIVVPLFYFLVKLRTYFVCSGRELKRLESLSKSPLFVAFADSLHGLVSIRSFNKVKQVNTKFENNLNENLKAWYSWLLANRWVGTRLDVTSWVILLLVTFGGVLMSAFGGINAGMLGFAITYAIQLSGVFQYMIRLSAQVETQMTGVERVMHYANNLTIEEDKMENVNTGAVNDKQAKEQKWPACGSIKFKNVSVRYRKDLPAVLKKLDFNVKGSQKIGIVGRTGSGKTSLINAILRLNEVFEGNIYIDGIDSSKITLALLRSNIGFVPQEPHLFAGTLRFNIDPFNKAADDEIWETLEKCNLKKYVKSLDMPIQESGGNLSVGQRQCVSLARALLHKAKIYIMDEATANIDNETDLWIQEMIRTNFADKTILTIAHRLDTIMDSDAVLVLDHGKVIEFGPPKELLNREEGVFKSMIAGSND